MYSIHFIPLILLVTTVFANKIERRIVSGKEVVPPFKYKFLVSIQVNGHHQFAGTLINRNTVVTVASKSLSPATEYTVNVHRHNLRKPSLSENGESIHVASIINYNGFNATTNLNDISIWKLKKKVIGDIGTIKVDDGSLGDGIGLSVITAGWGATDFYGARPKVLMKMSLTIYKKEECISHHEKGGPKYSSSNVICALNEIGSSACEGDAGNPLFNYSKGKFTLLGLVTSSNVCDKGIPPAFTRVSGYLDFINKYL